MNNFYKNILITIGFAIGIGLIAGSVQAQSFTFGAAGDYANGSNFRATVDAAKQQGVAFQLGLGDFSYSSGAEPGWCNTWKTSGVPVLLIAGNHDVGESSGGNIDVYRQNCTFPFSTMVGDYGKRYYFDYPQNNPIVRFIMITPGVKGSVSSLNTFNVGGEGYNFTSAAIDDARAKNIPWVVVGMHKNYISALEKSNEVGNDIMKLMFDKKVDLVLQGHEHGYERTKQLSCATTNRYDANCVVDSDSAFVKGAGTVIDVIGTGGQGLRGLNTGDSEYQYFAVADNTTYGLGTFTVSPQSLSYKFVRSTGGNLSDSFTIGQAGATTAPTQPPTSTQTPTRVPPTATPTPTSQAAPPTATKAPTNTPPPSTGVSCASVPTGTARAQIDVVVEHNATYRVWTRLMTTSTARQYWLNVNGLCYKVAAEAAVPNAQWAWVDYSDAAVAKKISIPMTAQSTYPVSLIADTPGIRIDRVMFVDDGCIPTGTGDNCAVVATATPMPTTIIPTNSPTKAPTVPPQATSTVSPTASTTPVVTTAPTPVPTETPEAPGARQASFYPTHDAYVRADRPDRNYDRDDTLQTDGSPIKKTYIKFDLTSLAGKKIDSAVLQLHITDSSSDTQTVSFVNNTSWGERVITYNNRPVNAETHQITTIPGGRKGDTVVVDLTSLVAERAGKHTTILIEQNGANGLDFYAREGKLPPKLQVTYQ